jgi:hypothetical protein
MRIPKLVMFDFKHILIIPLEKYATRLSITLCTECSIKNCQ